MNAMEKLAQENGQKFLLRAHTPQIIVADVVSRNLAISHHCRAARSLLCLHCVVVASKPIFVLARHDNHHHHFNALFEPSRGAVFSAAAAYGGAPASALPLTSTTTTTATSTFLNVKGKTTTQQ